MFFQLFSYQIAYGMKTGTSDVKKLSSKYAREIRMSDQETD